MVDIRLTPSPLEQFSEIRNRREKRYSRFDLDATFCVESTDHGSLAVTHPQVGDNRLTALVRYIDVGAIATARIAEAESIETRDIRGITHECRNLGNHTHVDHVCIGNHMRRNVEREADIDRRTRILVDRYRYISILILLYVLNRKWNFFTDEDGRRMVVERCQERLLDDLRVLIVLDHRQQKLGLREVQDPERLVRNTDRLHVPDVKGPGTAIVNHRTRKHRAKCWIDDGTGSRQIGYSGQR